MQRVRHTGVIVWVALLLTGPTLGWAQETGSSNLSWDRESLQSDYLAQHDFLVSLKSEDPTETGAGGAKAGEPALEEISQKLNNPLGDLWIINIENDTTTFKGFPLKDTQVFNTTIIQPVLPIPLSDEVSLITRPILPFVWGPVPQNLPSNFGAFPGEFPTEPNFGAIQNRVDTDREFNFGDMMFWAALAPATPWKLGEGQFVAGFGPTFIFPTASNSFIGSDKWSAGPVGVLAYLGKPLTAALIAQQWWSFAGDDDKPDVSKASFQYIIWYDLGNQWQVGTNPVVSVNWEADDGNKLTFPVGLGVRKTVRLGKLPVRIMFEVDYSAIHPDDIGSRWNFRLSFTPVIPNLLKGGF